MTRRQVFGLTGGGVSQPTSVASQLGEEPVLLTRSFPITAAGQSRIHTGFPLMTPGAQANRRSVEHSKSEGYSVSSDPCRSARCMMPMARLPLVTSSRRSVVGRWGLCDTDLIAEAANDPEFKTHLGVVDRGGSGWLGFVGTRADQRGTRERGPCRDRARSLRSNLSRARHEFFLRQR